MSTEYEVVRPVGRCAVSGREIRPGEPFHSALFETPQGFERRDYAAECWSGPPEGAYCVFRTRISEKPARRRTFIDDDSLIQFFLRLGEETDGLKRNFRFVLTLIMVRKRLLRYERSRKEGGAEFWQVRLARDGSLHEVCNPVLDESQVAQLSAELNAILASDGDESAADTAGETA